MEQAGRYPEQLNVKSEPLMETIAAVNKQEQYHLLDRAIVEVQLFQADRDYQLSGKIGNLSDNFSNFRHLTGDLQTAAHFEAEKRNNLNQIDSIYQGYLQEIDKAYQALPPYQPDQAHSEDYFRVRRLKLVTIIDLMNEIVSKAKKEQPELFVDDRSKNERVGLLDYNLLRPIAKGGHEHSPILADVLKRQGVSSLDDLLQIHFQPIFKQEGIGNRLTKIKESFVELAKLIVDKHPQIQGVTGTSWLLDNEAICRLIGFKIVGQCQDENWNQLIDQSGQINQERLTQLIKTGHLPMKNMIGYVGVIDFLKKFLPPEYRGQIKLIKLDPEWAEAYNDFEKDFQIEKKKLFALLVDGQINSEIDLWQQLDQFITVKEIFNQAGVLNNFVELLAKQNYKIDEIENNYPQEAKAIAEKINNYIAIKKQRKEISYQVEIN